MNPLAIFGYISLAAGGILTVFSRVPKETIKNQKDLIDTLSTEINALKRAHAENQAVIQSLQAKVEVLASVPLTQIAAAVDDIVHTQKEIIELIKKENA